MPLRTQPESLQRACMLSVARNFDYLCYRVNSRKEMSKMISDESYLQVEGPFKEMPGSVLGNIVKFCGENNLCVRRWHSHPLIRPQLDCMKIGWANDAETTLNMIYDRCQKLTRLDLGYLNNIGPGMFIKLMPRLTEIQVLKLNNSEVIDTVCEEIGKYCPRLMDLDISNTCITDIGLQSLCVDEAGDLRCQRLTKVTLAGSLISPRGIGIMLFYLPNLMEVDYERIFLVFDCVGEWGLSLQDIYGGKTKKLKLLSLTSVHNYINPETLEIACALCPYATTISLSNACLDNDLLLKVMAFENLTHLRLTNSDNLTMDFHEGVLPILTIKGHQLLTLLLVKFTSIDVAAIGECCPRLENIALDLIGQYEEILYPRENLFTKLHVAEIWTDLSVRTLNEVILKQLLMFCPDIKHLLVRSADYFTDKLLFDIWRENPMKKLSRFTVDGCPNISAAILSNIFDMENDITTIRVWNCFLITKQDEQKIQKRIKAENCDCYLEWYSYGD
ncbi:unnamed protein product [Meganyctiphanes norvegica]|uniref:Uncharacterized protein n=1 Tax=Meganyctiphanes norvegica TaxID=48144 RepID=A0AAV2QA18_MEGNR